jgi:hypothetical protein
MDASNLIWRVIKNEKRFVFTENEAKMVKLQPVVPRRPLRGV